LALTKKALVQIQGVFSELEKAMLVKKLRVARERKREQTGKCEVAPEVFQEIKRLHRRKTGQKRMTFQAIADKLNQAGYLNISGKQWTGYNVQKICQRF
jgi:hypothetical protein